MSASVASKNPFDPLGNDIEDTDVPPSSAPREVVKNTTTSKKREEKAAPPATGFARENGRGSGRRFGGNEGAYRDREAGRQNNRSKGTEENSAEGRDGYSGRGGREGRGGRGGRGHREFDRHSATGIVDTEKKVSQGWGGNNGSSEWQDELSGQEQAMKDAAGADPKDPNAVASTDAPAGEGEAAEVPEVEEEKVKTLDEYRAELEQRRADLGPPTELRRPNEGTQSNKKWAGKELSRKEEEEGVFFVGESKDRTRNRERKQKQVIELDTDRYTENSGGRGGRGRGGRGGRGRGGERGPREGGSRGDRPRGGDRAYHDYQRQEKAAPVLVLDSAAFPALGS